MDGCSRRVESAYDNQKKHGREATIDRTQQNWSVSLLEVGRQKANGAQGRNRTSDTRIFNPLLYHLSYLGAIGTGRLY